MFSRLLTIGALVIALGLAGAAWCRQRVAEPSGVQPGSAADGRMRDLRKQQIEAAHDEVQTRTRDYLHGHGNTQLLYEAYRRLLQAQLQSSDQKADRVTVLEAYVKWARDVEDYISGRVEAGRYPRTELDVATYYRLDAEIRLEQARGPGASR